MGRPGPNCKPRICVLCGTSYIPTSGVQRCCGREIEVPCAVCGKLFKKRCTTSDTNRTCSEKCNIEFQKIRRSETARSKKKICKWCGKEFTASHVRVVYCEGPHYKKCAICGKEFEIDVKNHRERQTCSKECFVKLQLSHRDIQAEHEKQKQVLLEKYGVENSALIPGAMEKAKQTMRSKYGVDWYTQTDEYKEKVKKTSLEKYGVDSWLSSKDVIEKREATVLERYGVRNVFESEEIKHKIAKHYQDLYGVNTYSQSVVENSEEWEAYKEDCEKYLETNFPDGATFQEIISKLGVCLTSIQNYTTPEAKEKYIKRDFSTMETDVTLFLKSLKEDIIILHHQRKLIPPYEIDIFLPEYNVGIECNPTYTHNASVEDPWSKEIHPSSYHKMKTDCAEEKGIFLLHLFGYEWKHKRKIMESIIRNLLNLNDTRIYARNTRVNLVSYNDSIKFLVENHRQGSATSSVRLGLYFNNELVSLMTFGKPRRSISEYSDQTDDWELIRFCNKLNTSVIGSASKLFKYFIDNYQFSSIVSYSSRSHTRGKIYDILGFNLVKYTEPGYVWVNTKTDNYYNRYNTQKHKLSKLFPEEDLDLTKTEKQTMLDHGYVQVFDSGNVVWRYSMKTSET